MKKITVYPKAEYVSPPEGSKRKQLVLSKEFIQKAYVEMGLSRVELAKHCGVSEKIFSNSYVVWFTSEERKDIGGRKISLAQRTKNSNSHNKGKPNVILSESLLSDMVKAKFALEKMARILKVAPQTVRNNLEYYGLADKLVKGGLAYRAVLATHALDKLFGTKIQEGLIKSYEDLDANEVQVALTDILFAEQGLTSLRNELGIIRKNLGSRFIAAGKPLKNFNLPQSKLNSKVKKILNDLGYVVYSEFEVSGKFYDFKFKGYKLLLEIDSEHYHSQPEQIANDKLKTAIATANGYKLIRVIVGKSDKISSLTNKLHACLKPLKLLKSHQ